MSIRELRVAAGDVKAQHHGCCAIGRATLGHLHPQILVRQRLAAQSTPEHLGRDRSEVGQIERLRSS